MGRSRESFSKGEIRKKKEKKRKQKLEKKMAKRENDSSGGMDDMIAYVDEFGNITDQPKEPQEKEEVELEDIEVSIPKSAERGKDRTATGRVTHFNESKGYGFIAMDDTRESIFVHVNNVEDEIQEGSRVEFETEKGQKGLAAINVKVIK